MSSVLLTIGGAVGSVALVVITVFVGFCLIQEDCLVKDFFSRIIGTKDHSEPKTDRSSVSNSSVVIEKVQQLALSLVLKGKKLGDIRPNTTLSLEELAEALSEANYFLCTSQQKMEEIQQGMNLNNALDTDSEQQVLVVIYFESELEEGKTFSNKLELNQFLKKGKSQRFKVDSVSTLVKVSGLTKAGFIRS